MSWLDPILQMSIQILICQYTTQSVFIVFIHDEHWSSGLPDILLRHQDLLFYPCRDTRVYSHCQRHYLISYSFQRKRWMPYRTVNRMNWVLWSISSWFIIINIWCHTRCSSHVWLLLSCYCSLDKQDRLQNLLNRWNGPVVIVIALSIEETEGAIQLIKQINDKSVLIHLYIRENDIYNNCDDNFIMSLHNNILFRDCHTLPLYPTNLLRAIGVNTVKTTHYTVVDSDLFISNTLRTDVLKLPVSILRNPKAVLLYPTFAFNSTIVKGCIKNQTCDDLWSFSLFFIL